MRFAALRAPWYKGYLIGGALAMGGDQLEHAITYYVLWQQFHSPLLAGFAVISHWLPYLLDGLFVGSLADRFDCRRLVQIGQSIFILVSIAWAVLFLTNTLQPWEAMVLLVFHGIAGSLWLPTEQRLLYDMVGQKDLPSAVRLQATGNQIGMLIGPAIGAVLLVTVGPWIGMFLNVVMYLPFTIYLFIVPFTGHVRDAQAGIVRPRQTLRSILGVIPELPKYPRILVVMALQGAVGLFIGTALVPLLPEFGDLNGVSGGFGYTLILIAMGAGAVVGGVTLEASGRARASTRLAITASIVFSVAVLTFSFSRSLALTFVVLFFAGLGNLVSASTSQTIVQLDAPPERRGAFIGASGMATNGFRTGAGILMGILTGLLGVPMAVAVDSALLLVVAVVLMAVVVTHPRLDEERTIPAEQAVIEEPAE